MSWDPRDKLLVQNIAKVFVIKAYAMGTFQNDRVPSVVFCWLFFFLVCKPHWTMTYTEIFIKEKIIFQSEGNSLLCYI